MEDERLFYHKTFCSAALPSDNPINLGIKLRSSEKKPAGTDRQVKTMRGQGKRIGDADSQRLQKLAKHIGNDVLSKHLNQKSGQRDEILAFICSRLKTVYDVQGKERNEIKNERSWFKEVAKGKAGFHLPDPTRWHECTRYFQKAGEALCNGHLGKGVQLLDKALEHERAAYNSIPIMVKNKLDGKEQTPNKAPQVAQGIGSGEFCPAVTKPKELYFADRILNIRDQMRPSPPLSIEWWKTTAGDEEEEEEEEEEE